MKYKKVMHLSDKNHSTDDSLGWESYLELENKYAFNKWARNANRKTIKFSVTVGAKFPVKDIIDTIGHHVFMSQGIFMRYKGIQILDTDSSQAILGLDTKALRERVVWRHGGH